MKLLQEKGCETHLTVVGRVADKRVFRQITSDKHTTYIPPKDKTELIHIYRDNDIFVMPSHTESFGLVYAEAMSQGLPVVYTKGQGFDGQFPEGEIGYSVNSNSIESVAEAIERIILEYDIITKDIAYKVGKYNWPNICLNYRKIYQFIFDTQ